MRVQVTDDLPRVGWQTFAAALLLTFIIAFSMHAVFKVLTLNFAVKHYVTESQLADTASTAAAKSIVDLTSDPDGSQTFDRIVNGVLDAALYVPVPLLERQTSAVPGVDATPPDRVTILASLKEFAGEFKTPFFPFLETYFDSNLTAAQVYQYLIPECNWAAPEMGGTTDALAACQAKLLTGVFYVTGHLKKDGLFIAYRLQAGWMQLMCLYVFSLGLVVLRLRGTRAEQLLYYVKAPHKFEERFGGEKDLEFRKKIARFWHNRDPNQYSQITQLGAVYYEPGSREDLQELRLKKGREVSDYHIDLTEALKKQGKGTELLRRHRDVLPKSILRVVSAFVVDQKYFPSGARQRATQALDHAIDEIAATFTIDRDLYSRCVELVPVIGFFGTVWGLSLAMLGASDVIRAQDTNWMYHLGETFFTAELLNSSERQQLALDGMLGALSIKFDTTGYALLLMFLLIVFGARATRREHRALSVLHSAINETTVLALPTFGEDDALIFDDKRLGSLGRSTAVPQLPDTQTPSAGRTPGPPKK